MADTQPSIFEAFRDLIGNLKDTKGPKGPASIIPGEGSTIDPTKESKSAQKTKQKDFIKLLGQDLKIGIFDDFKKYTKIANIFAKELQLGKYKPREVKELVNPIEAVMPAERRAPVTTELKPKAEEGFFSKLIGYILTGLGLAIPFLGGLAGGVTGGLFATMAKALGKTLLKGLKIIPFIGTLISIYDAIQRFRKGDIIQGMIDILSGIAFLVPGYGTAIGLALTALNAIIDFNVGNQGKGVQKSSDELIIDWIKSLGDWFEKNVTQPIYDWLVDKLSNVLGKEIATHIVDALAMLVFPIPKLASALGSLVGWFETTDFEGKFNESIDWVKNCWDNVVGIFDKIKDFAKQKTDELTNWAKNILGMGSSEKEKDLDRKRQENFDRIKARQEKAAQVTTNAEAASIPVVGMGIGSVVKPITTKVIPSERQTTEVVPIIPQNNSMSNENVGNTQTPTKVNIIPTEDFYSKYPQTPNVKPRESDNTVEKSESIIDPESFKKTNDLLEDQIEIQKKQYNKTEELINSIINLGKMLPQGGNNTNIINQSKKSKPPTNYEDNRTAYRGSPYHL